MSGRITRVSLAFATCVAFVTSGCSGGGKGSFSDALDHLVVSPDGATIDTSATIPVKATGVTASGRHVDVTGLTWTASSGAVDGSNVFTPGAAGDATLTASAQGKTGTGTIHVVAPGSFHAKVVDAATGSAITGATVTLVLTSNFAATTAADGTATITNAAVTGNLVVHSSAANYVPITLFDVKSRSVRIPMRPASPPVGGQFRGTIDFSTAFDRTDPPSGSLWVGVSGPSIKGNILAFGLDSLLGPNRPISISGFNLNAPSNVFVYGVTSDYIAPAPAGQTAAWALGGEITLQQISDIIGGGTSDLGAVITQLLPTFNSFFYTLKDGLTVTSGQTLQGQDLILDTKLAKIEKLNVPPRPVNDPNPLVVGAIDLGNAEGFVPAGLTVVQGATTPDTEVHVPTLSGQFDGKKYLFLTVSQEGGLGSSTNDQQVAVLSRGITGQSTVDMPEFLVPPAIGSFSATAATGVISFPVSDKADFLLQTFSKTVTLGTGTNAVSTVYDWDVATAGGSTGFTLPTALVTGTSGASAGSGWTVQSLGLESTTYEGVLSDGGAVDLSSYFNDANRIVISRSTVN